MREQEAAAWAWLLSSSEELRALNFRFRHRCCSPDGPEALKELVHWKVEYLHPSQPAYELGIGSQMFNIPEFIKAVHSDKKWYDVPDLDPRPDWFDVRKAKEESSE